MNPGDDLRGIMRAGLTVLGAVALLLLASPEVRAEEPDLLAVGAWRRGSTETRELGGPIEFKSGGEFAYRFDNDARLGLLFDHISNAGIYKKNPGVESALLVYSIPLRW